MSASIRHKHTSGAYGAVKHLHQSLLISDIQIRKNMQKRIPYTIICYITADLGNGIVHEIIILWGRALDIYIRFLMCSISIQKLP